MTKSKNHLRYFILVCSFILVSCHKSHENPGPDKPKETDVYVYGALVSFPYITELPVYYKNGKSNSLSNTALNGVYNISALSVINDSVFAVGQSKNSLIFWENGIQHVYNNPDIDFVSENSIVGNDIYTSFNNYQLLPGTTLNTTGGYALNGTTAFKFTGEASGIITTGSDIYCYGDTAVSSSLYTELFYATYYKNKIPVHLGNIGSSQQSKVTSMCISGIDVYAAGYTYPDSIGDYLKVQVPVYWKNGIMTILPSGGYNSYPTSIAVKGNDVYVAGYIHNGEFDRMMVIRTPHATLWKNGVVTTLSQTTGESSTTNLILSGNDVYVGGTEVTDSLWTLYWKNGNPVKFKFPVGKSGFNEIGIQVVTN